MKKLGSQLTAVTMEPETIAIARTFAKQLYRGEPSVSDGIRQMAQFADRSRALLACLAEGEMVTPENADELLSQFS